MEHLLQSARVAFPPPQYLAVPTAGIEITHSGVKFVTLKRTVKGLVVDAFGSYRYGEGVVERGDIMEKEKMVSLLKKIAKNHQIHAANVALPEQKSYLFQADLGKVSAQASLEEKTAEHIAEQVPLPPREARFVVRPLAKVGGAQIVTGVAYARRVVQEYRNVIDAAGMMLRGMESEMHATPRAVIPFGEKTTYMVIDIGKSTTKIFFIQDGTHPVFATSITLGGHALTRAVQKHFGVTEDEAKAIKRDKGIIPEEGDDEYIASMLSTLSAMRDEVTNWFRFWQERVAENHYTKPIEKVLVTGGNASVRGLPEYFAAALGVPVTLANPFVNLAPVSEVVPAIEHEQSLAYTTAIGLALRDFLSYE